ncbi:MAG: M28 family metallopeptidase [Pseudobdellovibrionaceae bacterium]
MKNLIRSSTFIFSLSLLLVTFSLTAAAAFRCDQAHSGTAKRQQHSAYLIGHQIQIANLRESILDLSGRKPIDEKGCLDGRCEDGSKKRVRNYLKNKIESLGLKMEVEEVFPKHAKLETNEDLVDGPLDFRQASSEFKAELFNLKQYHWIQKVLLQGGLLSRNSATGQNEIVGYERLNKASTRIFFQMLQALSSSSRYENVRWPGFKQTWGQIAHELSLTEKPAKVRLLRTQVQDLLARLEYGEGLERSTSRDPIAVNVMAEIKGSQFPNEIIEINAHYDTVPKSPGADDNGTGLATLLEMIRIFQKNPPKRTLRFVFTDLEEFGFVGSRYHSRLVAERRDNILAAMVIDTIGYTPTRAEGVLPIFVAELGTRAMHPTEVSYDKADAFAQVMERQFGTYQRALRLSTETDGALPTTADHGSYIRNGLPGILIAAPFEGDYKNPGYHRPNDVIENIHWPYFVNIAQFLTESVARLSDARNAMTIHLERASAAFLSSDSHGSARVTITEKQSEKFFRVSETQKVFDENGK